MQRLGAPIGDDAVRAAIDAIVRERLRAGATLTTTVLTGSMRVLIDPGDRVDVRWCPPEAIAVGDVVVARVAYGYRVHRVVAVARQAGAVRLRTAGDLSPRPDAWIDEGDYVGRVAVVRKRHAIVDLDETSGKCLDRGARAIATGMLLRHRLRLLVRDAVVRSARHAALDAPYRAAYHVAFGAAARALARVPGVRAVHVRRSFASGDWVPGQSDIDLTVVVARVDRRTTARVWRTVARWKRRFPFLGEVLLVDDATFERFCRFGARAPALCAHRAARGGDARYAPYVFDPEKHALDLFNEADLALATASDFVARRWTEGPPGAVERAALRKAAIDLLAFRAYGTSNATAPADAPRRGRRAVLADLRRSAAASGDAELARAIARIDAVDAADVDASTWTAWFVDLLILVQPRLRDVGARLAARGFAPRGHGRAVLPEAARRDVEIDDDLLGADADRGEVIARIAAACARSAPDDAPFFSPAAARPLRAATTLDAVADAFAPDARDASTSRDALACLLLERALVGLAGTLAAAANVDDDRAVYAADVATATRYVTLGILSLELQIVRGVRARSDAEIRSACAAAGDADAVRLVDALAACTGAATRGAPASPLLRQRWRDASFDSLTARLGELVAIAAVARRARRA